MRRGPWPERVVARLERALHAIDVHLRAVDAVVGLVLYGSYARGEQGQKSDVDLLVLFEGARRPEMTPEGGVVLKLAGEVEAAERLPMHLSLLLASVDRPEDLGAELLHAVWADGIVLYARAGALARLQPAGLVPWALVRFSLGDALPGERVRLSRRLHGVRGRGGVLGPGAVTLSRGALLVPGERQAAVRAALDEAGATYDIIPVWREA